MKGIQPDIVVNQTITDTHKGFDAAATDDKATYIKNRAFDDEHYKKMIESFIEQYGSASRKELDELIMEKLSAVLSDKQKKAKLNNLISALRKDGRIKNIGTDFKKMGK
ncbi:MAG: hypothetical protein ABUT20_59285 [Bacteroidota bacterium]